MNQYKAVLFDFGGTLFAYDPTNYQILAKIGQKYGKKINPTDPLLSQAFQKQEEKLLKIFQQQGNYEVQNLSKDDWIHLDRLLLSTIGINEDQALLDLIQAFSAREFYFKITPDIIETLHQLKQEGYHLGIVSNCKPERVSQRYDTLQKHGLMNLFEVIILSGEHGIRKPNPAIFKLALDRLPNILPKEVVYVGDSYIYDCLGARNAGFTPLLLDPNLGFTWDCDLIASLTDLRIYLEISTN